MANLIKDHTGKDSTMRVMCFFSLLTAIGLAFYTLHSGVDTGVELVMWFLISAFAPKAVQKFIETKG